MEATRTGFKECELCGEDVYVAETNGGYVTLDLDAAKQMRLAGDGSCI
jgi:hypothetical protein